VFFILEFVRDICESPIPVQETPTRFHRPAQRYAFLRPDVRQQSRSFTRWNQSLRHSPQLQPAFLRLSAMISQSFTRRIVPLLFSAQQLQNDMNGRHEAGFSACPVKTVTLQGASSMPAIFSRKRIHHNASRTQTILYLLQSRR
jgi:hypothetical protein